MYPTQLIDTCAAWAGHGQYADRLGLRLPAAETPAISIIIPVHNQVEYTLRCLEAVGAHSGGHACEVIVVDDASDDATFAALSDIPNLKVVRNFSNLGFVRGCNRGARLARGDYIVFLNNDTEVQAGWLDALRAIFERHPDAGLAGAKLVYPDGKLQEAGGILWADGSAWNYGHSSDPARPEFNYVRETDYCSGACLMVPRALWTQLGGFDEQFAPAYCEDSDLALRVRAAGRKVYYQPAAVVVHHEGRSNGVDTAAGLKRHQVTNTVKLARRWEQTFAREHRPNGRDVFRARERSLRRKVILFIDHYVPHYDRDAGSRTIWCYVNFFLAAGYSVKFIGDNFHAPEPYLGEMQQRGVEVLTGRWYADHWQEWLAENGRHLDLVFLSRAHTAARYLEPLRRHTRAKLLFYGHDLLSRTAAREFAATGQPEAREKMERWTKFEDAIFGKVDVVYYPSAEEIRHLAAERPGLVAKQLPPYVFPDEPRTDYRATFARRSGAIFVGGFGHPPNVDAMTWFAREIWPRVLARRPGQHLTIVGSHPPAEVRALASDSVTVTGFVSDERLQELYDCHQLVVAPLRQGGGIKGKIIEALWHGLPILTTPVGAEGIPDAATCVRIAPPEDYAAALLELLGEPGRLLGLAAAGRDVLAQHYSAAALRRAFSADVELP